MTSTNFDRDEYSFVEHPDKEHPDEEHPDEEHLNEEHPNEEHHDEEHTDKEHPSEEHPDEEHYDEEHTDKKHLNEEHTDEEHIQSDTSSSCMKSEKMSRKLKFNYLLRIFGIIAILEGLFCLAAAYLDQKFDVLPTDPLSILGFASLFAGILFALGALVTRSRCDANQEIKPDLQETSNTFQWQDLQNVDDLTKKEQ